MTDTPPSFEGPFTGAITFAGLALGALLRLKRRKKPQTPQAASPTRRSIFFDWKRLRTAAREDYADAVPRWQLLWQLLMYRSIEYWRGDAAVRVYLKKVFDGWSAAADRKRAKAAGRAPSWWSRRTALQKQYLNGFLLLAALCVPWAILVWHYDVSVLFGLFLTVIVMFVGAGVVMNILEFYSKFQESIEQDPNASQKPGWVKVAEFLGGELDKVWWHRVFKRELKRWPKVYHVGTGLDFRIVARFKKPRQSFGDGTKATWVFLCVCAVWWWQLKDKDAFGAPAMLTAGAAALLTFFGLRFSDRSSLTIKINSDGMSWTDLEGQIQSVPWEDLVAAQMVVEPHPLAAEEMAELARWNKKGPAPMPVYAFASQVIMWSGFKQRERLVVAEIAKDSTEKKARLLLTAIEHVVEVTGLEMRRQQTRLATQGSLED